MEIFCSCNLIHYVKAKAKGYDQVLWLDAIEHKYIQEVGTMNIFFKINGVFITPLRDGSILDGITRMSVIDILKHKGFQVVERAITIDEIITAYKNGTAYNEVRFESLETGKTNLSKQKEFLIFCVLCSGQNQIRICKTSTQGGRNQIRIC